MVAVSDPTISVPVRRYRRGRWATPLVLVLLAVIAAALFMAIKAINRLKAAPAPAEPAAPPAPPRNEVLLEEIRDLLKK